MIYNLGTAIGCKCRYCNVADVVGWFVGWLVGLLVDLLVGWLICWLIG